jgi:uncharacterized membrane protein YbhN (UPF0104 family)
LETQNGKISIKRHVYRWILFALTLAAVAWFISRNYRLVSQYSFEFKPFLLTLSFLSVAAAFLLRFCVWLRLASLLDLEAPLPKAGRAYFLSVLARYIPGKVGLALVRVEAYRGYPAAKVVMGTGMELIAALSAALLLSFIGLAASPAQFPPYLRWLALVAIAPLIAILSPPVLRTVANSILRLARKPAIEQFTPFRINIALVGLYMIPGLVHGLGLFFLLNALSPVSGSHYLAITGSYYAASLAGLAAFFAPGGLGVREGVLFLVLPLLVPRESAIVAAITIRLVTVLAELALAGVFAGWARISRADARDETGSPPD